MTAGAVAEVQPAVARSTPSLAARRAWVVVAQGSPAACALALTPVLLGAMGPSDFGRWATLSAALTVLSSVDGGIGATAARVLARASHDTVLLSRTLTSLLAAVAVLVVGLVVLVAPAASAIAAAVLHDDTTAGALTIALLPAAVAFVLVNAVLTSLLNAVDRYRTVALATALPQSGLFVTTVVLRVSGAARLTVLVLLVALLTALAATTLLLVLHLVRARTVRWARILTRPELAEIARFAGRAQVISVVALVNIELDTLVVGAVLGPRQAAVYAVAAQAAIGFRNIPLWFVLPSVVDFTRSSATDSPAELLRREQRLRRSWLATLAPYAVLSLGSLPPLVLAWVGSDYRSAAALGSVLLAANLLNLCGATVSGYLRAVGRPGVEVRAGLVSVVLNGGITGALTPFVGLAGVAVGTAVAQVAATVLLARGSGLAVEASTWRGGRPVRRDVAVALALVVAEAVTLLVLGGLDVVRPPLLVAPLGLLLALGLVHVAHRPHQP